MSANQNDVRERWCGACHGATGHPPPPGMRLWLFRGGSLDRTGRLIEDRLLPDSYDVVETGETYVRRAGEFVLR
jgi:hypothetical protein